MYILTVRYSNYFDAESVHAVSYLFDNKQDACKMWAIYYGCSNVTMCYIMDAITGEIVD